MKQILSFIGNHICRLVISAGLIALGIHWGLMGFIPFFIIFLLWE